MSHVFLSYSRSDRRLATRVRDDLSDRGLEVWSDRRLGLGGSWLAEISAAIDGARAVVLLATPAALASKWVMREVEAARALGKPVVPLLAGGSRFGDLPASLAGINGVDLADGYENSVRSIAEAFACAAVEPDLSVEVLPGPLPMLLLLTSDDSMAAIVAEVARPVGLAVVRPDPLTEDVLAVAARAHVALIDGRMSGDCGFIAGYVAGRGGRMVCVNSASGWSVPEGAGVRFCQAEAADLEREICVAAFLPVRGLA
ncbi:toll/interleukin-1 receptor domain-containing protein [Actinophytocola sp.]|uniref:toll/interleukin-1 receptor domain-containing protein n=1 Tax=Actinophytocola sp. TaxID=1872138 RepID=UPI00389A659B